jgi:hypothetical protein
VWCDFNSSSNLLWLTHLRGRELRLPVLTNTFAVPPSRLEGVLAVCRGKADFDALRRTQRPEAVVLELSSAAAPLARRLLRQADWTLVHLDATHAGFLPRRTATAQGAVPIRQEMLSVPRLLESARKRAGDDARSAAMRVGRSLFFLGWITAAGDAFVAAVEADPREAAGWNLLGVCRAREGVELLNAGDWRGRRKLLQAAQAYRRTLELRPEFPPARRSLRAVEKILSDLETGVVPPPAEVCDIF